MTDVTAGSANKAEDELVSPDGASRRLTPAEWIEIKELYELGKLGITELADTYKISRQSLSRRFKNEGVTKGSRAHEVAAKVNSMATTPSPAATRADTYASKRAEWIEETRVQGYTKSKAISNILFKMVLDQRAAIAAGAAAPMAAIHDDIKTLMLAQKAQIMATDAALRWLEADRYVDPNELPNLTIEDLTDQDLLDHFVGNDTLPEGTSIEEMNRQIEEARAELEDES